MVKMGVPERFSGEAASAELSEAINSMFCWYRDAAECYVYLSDVSVRDCNKNDQFSVNVGIGFSEK